MERQERRYEERDCGQQERVDQKNSERRSMMSYRTIITLLVLSVVCFGCAPKLSLKNDVFQGKPLWESTTVFPEDRQKSRDALDLSPEKAPGLYLLVEQVIPENRSDFFTDKRESAKDNSDLIPERWGEKQRPLPPEIAQLNVTKAYVRSLLASTRPASRRTKALPGTTVLSLDEKLTIDDFKDFGLAMMKTGLSLYQEGQEGRMDKLWTFLNQRKLTWEGIAYTYFVAYFSDEFVDRTGGTVGRPKLGVKITNETLAGFITVGLESIYDYAMIGAEQIKNPVVWEVKNGKEVWQTAGGKKPTLVSITQMLKGRTVDDSTVNYDYVVEPLTDDTQPGISKRKLELIRLLSGYAGDISGSLSDLIVREFGGIDIGFVILGRVSVGDNDTLAKLVQTIIDITAHRSTEAFVATYLYDITKPAVKGRVPKCGNKSSVERLLGACE
jgi:hypothetical protein